MYKLYIFSAFILIVLTSIIGYSFLKKGATVNPVFNLNENSISTNNSVKQIPIDGNSMMMGMVNMSDMVKDDQAFLENMIPHHQEAVDSSNQILKSITDPELKSFVQNVISAQVREIDEMKIWYKTWFNKEYVFNSNYQAMMGGMKGKTGIELDKEYVRGMIMHHQGAIQMATKIQTMTKRPELLKLAYDIITSQTRERDVLMNWMMSKYNDHSMMGR
jgi:uncharacterized protein (DUF305 family)